MKQFFQFLVALFGSIGKSKKKRIDTSTVWSSKEISINEVKTIPEEDMLGQKFPELVIADIEQHDFPEDQYYKKITKKHQVVLHHTVSGQGVRGDLNHWLSTTARVATCVIIGQDGVIHQCFSTKYWGHHIGIKSYQLQNEGFTGSENRDLNKYSVGVELDSYGGLIKKDGVWRNVYGGVIKDDMVYMCDEPYRGYEAFEKYTEKQIVATMSFLIYLNKTYNIPLDYKGDEMFGVDKRALGGEKGIWTHASFRSDKSDCYPDPQLKKYLKMLKQYEV